MNIKKLSADERAQIRAAQGKDMDQWIDNDVRSRSATEHAFKERVGFTLGKWLRTQEERRQNPSCCERLHRPRPDNSLRLFYTQSTFETAHSTDRCFARFSLEKAQLLKLETAVYGLRNAPKAWWKRVCRDLTENGRVQHQLDQCTFMFMNSTQLVGLMGVYVGDFLVAGCDDGPILSAAMS